MIIGKFDILDHLDQDALGNMITASKWWQRKEPDRCPLAFSFMHHVSIHGGNSFLIEMFENDLYGMTLNQVISHPITRKSQVFINEWDKSTISTEELEQEILNRIDLRQQDKESVEALECWIKRGTIGIERKTK